MGKAMEALKGNLKKEFKTPDEEKKKKEEPGMMDDISSGLGKAAQFIKDSFDPKLQGYEGKNRYKGRK